MGRKLVVVGGVAAGMLLFAGAAYAHDEYDADGGHCEYGDFSVNIENDCDTNNGGGGGDLRPVESLRDVLDDLPPAG